MKTKLIVGLGNPGNEYINNRHNIGFMVIDFLADKFNIRMDKKNFNGIYGFIKNNDSYVILAKPLTYMNLSGEFVYNIAKFYKINLENILIIYDDIDTPFGKIKVKSNGSSGGQNGIKNIIDCFKNQNISRIKIGIGRPNNQIEIKNWVLSNFTETEKEELKKTINKVASAVEYYFNNPILKVMNQFNK